MTKGYFIVRGDKTTCGGVVLEGQSNDTLYGKPRAYEGHRVTCGNDGKTYTIQGGISFMRAYGRLIAGTLDSISGCPCRARLINSQYNGTYECRRKPSPQWTVNASQACEAPVNPSPEASPLTPQSSPALPLAPLIITAPCEHPDRMEELASYIADEMNRNIHHPSVLKMKELNSYDAVEETRKYFAQPFYLTIGHTPNFNAIELAKKAEAFALWTERVGQNRPWDHKPIFLKRYKGIAWHKQGFYDYFHDIWSNIHYGYIGLAAGFSESVLMDGAGLEQIGSDIVRKFQAWEKNPGPHRSAEVAGLRAWDDVADRLSITIGMKLYGMGLGRALEGADVMNEVLSYSPEEWGRDGVVVHDCFRGGNEDY